MKRDRPMANITKLAGTARLLAAGGLLSVAIGCSGGPSVSGSFDRTYTVSGHTRLELNNVSGDVTITGSADGKVHVHGDVRATGSGLQESQKRLSELQANPPVEQTADGVRIGKDVVRLRNTSITYTIEVPKDTEVGSNVASGSQTIRGLRGPVKAQSVSGAVRAENIDGDAQLTSASGAVSASNMGNSVRATSMSGAVTVDGAKDDVRASSQSGKVSISKVTGRIEADSTSGALEISGVTGDAKIQGVSGALIIHGNPAANSFWDLRTVSSTVEVGSPQGANVHLLAEAMTGNIRTDLPIMIEEQGKHSLRAQIGNGGARIEVHTVSGEIHLLPAN
jgi:hypothetical protein